MHFQCRFAIIIKHRATRAVRAGQQMNMGAFPSGQWGQTVNLLLNASVVRIHQLPPKGCDKNVVTAFFLCYIAENRHLRRPIFKVRFTVLSNRFLAVGLFYLQILTACPLPYGLIFNFFQENFRFSLLFSEYFQFPRSQFPVGCGDFLFFLTVFSLFSIFPFSTYI